MCKREIDWMTIWDDSKGALAVFIFCFTFFIGLPWMLWKQGMQRDRMATENQMMLKGCEVKK